MSKIITIHIGEDGSIEKLKQLTFPPDMEIEVCVKHKDQFDNEILSSLEDGESVTIGNTSYSKSSLP